MMVSRLVGAVSIWQSENWVTSRKMDSIRPSIRPCIRLIFFPSFFCVLIVINNRNINNNSHIVIHMNRTVCVKFI